MRFKIRGVLPKYLPIVHHYRDVVDAVYPVRMPRILLPEIVVHPAVRQRTAQAPPRGRDALGEVQRVNARLRIGQQAQLAEWGTEVAEQQIHEGLGRWVCAALHQRAS